VRGEKQADVLNTMVAMGLGLASGCAFPAQALPRFLREDITPWLPPFWFVDGVRRVQSGDPGGTWWWAVAALVVTGLVLIMVGALGWRRGLARGGGR
jgi:ABC-type multidrug transport system permease subunit